LHSSGAESLSSSLLSRNFKNKVFITISLLVLYGCKSWSPTLKEEHTPRVVENRVFRVFGLAKDEMTWELRKVHNEELNDLYCSPNIVRLIKSKIMR
jgi:hypothetical protein